MFDLINSSKLVLRKDYCKRPIVYYEKKPGRDERSENAFQTHRNQAGEHDPIYLFRTRFRSVRLDLRIL
jgi:hypothetical protein